MSTVIVKIAGIDNYIEKNNYLASGNIVLIAHASIRNVVNPVLTIDLSEEILEENEVILNVNNIPTLLHDLMRDKIVSEPLRYVQSGFIKYPVVKLLKDF